MVEKTRKTKQKTGAKKTPAVNLKTHNKTGKTPAKSSRADIAARKDAAATTKNNWRVKPSLRSRKVQEIKKVLLSQRTALLNEALEALNSLPGHTALPDVSDQASAEIDISFMFRLREREKNLLKKINTALEIIDNGTFGICEACGQEIDIKRIEARPITTMCITCKTEQEEEEKHNRKAG